MKFVLKILKKTNEKFSEKLGINCIIEKWFSLQYSRSLYKKIYQWFYQALLLLEGILFQELTKGYLFKERLLLVSTYKNESFLILDSVLVL